MYETLVVMVKCLGYPGTDTFEMSVPVYPSIQYQFSKKTVASFSAVMLVQVGISLTLEPSLSVIVKRQLNPSSSGRGPIKSIVMLFPHSSGIGRGCSGPAGFVVLDLFQWQGIQPGKNDCSRSLCMFSH